MHDHLPSLRRRSKQYRLCCSQLPLCIILHDAHHECDAHNDDNDDSLSTAAQILDRVDFGPILDNLHNIHIIECHIIKSNVCDKRDARDNDNSVSTAAQIFDGFNFGPILDDLCLIHCN
jgi:hypothetical protein